MKKTIQQIFQQAVTADTEGKFNEAEHFYIEILKEEPNNPFLHNNLGIILKKLGRSVEAERAYKKAIEFKPDYAEAHNNLANVLKELGQLDQAEASYKKAIEFKPDYAEAHYNLGNFFYTFGTLSEAEVSLKNAIQYKPNLTLAHNYLANILRENGKFEEAIELYSKGLEIDPKNPIIEHNLIHILKIFTPNKKTTNSIVIANNNLKQIKNNFSFETGIKKQELNRLFKNSNKIIQDNNKALTINQTEIFRSNSVNLGCERHMGVFGEFNIVPRACFSCFKIQIEPKNVFELFKLFFIFDKLELPNNNIRKCMIELRPKVSGTYKGLIYCSSIKEVNEILKIISPTIDKIITGKIGIKRGCSEYEEAFPDYKEIDENNNNFMKYNKDWEEKEKIFDTSNTKNLLNTNISLRGILMQDILTMNNWLYYAKKLNDLSYKDISEEIFYSDHVSKEILKQLTTRKKNFDLN